MTKKQKGMLDAYKAAFNRGPKTELYQVYGSYSRKKQEALDYCKKLEMRFRGFDATIVGASSHFFSYAFKYVEIIDGMSRMCLCYCTHANDYKFCIE